MPLPDGFPLSSRRAPPLGLCVASMELLDVGGAAITLMTADHSGPVCATSAEVALLEELQFTLGEGPSRDAFRRDSSVAALDLGAPTSSQWPTFALAAVDRGFRAVFAYQLRVAATTFGVLTLYQRTIGPSSGVQTANAPLVAVALARVIADPDRSLGDAAGIDATGSRHRAAVHQASGMLAVQLGVDVGHALAVLRARASAADRSVSELAADIVQHHRTAAEAPASPDRL